MVNWVSVRLLLTVAILKKLPIQSVDFVLEFPQACLPEDDQVLMELPMGMVLESRMGPQLHILEIQKNCYGLKKAKLNFYKLLRK